jgi:ABC-2 type transport system permease protein
VKSLNDLRLLFVRPFLQDFHNPTWLFVGLSTPIMYLLLFMPLLNKLAGGPGFPASHVIQVFLPGIIALLAFGSANGAGFGMIFLIKSGFIERMRVTPSSRLALLMGPILSGVVWTLIFVALIVGISVPFGFKIHLAGLLVFAVLLVLMIILFSGIFTSLAILSKGEIGTLAAIANGVNLPLMLLAGVMLPLTLAPHWMRTLAHINPLYYVVTAGRALADGQIMVHPVKLAFAVITPLTLLVIWWSLRVYRKAVA